MSVGKSYLRAILEHQSLSSFRGLRTDWLVEDEVPAFDYIRSHVRRYGTLPDYETVRENGFTLNRAREPIAYYENRFRERALYSEINERHPAFLDAMKTKRMDNALAVLRDMLTATTSMTPVNDITRLDQEVIEVLREYEDAAANPGGLRGVTLGFSILDEVTSGAQPGDVIVLAGRPNIGKSYGILHMAHEAWMAGHPVAFLSLEMQNRQSARRMLGIHTGTNPDFLRRGQMSGHNEARVYTAAEEFSNRPPFYLIEGNFRKSVADVDNYIQEFEPDILFIDAAYLLSPERSNGKGGSRWEQIATVIEELKGVALARGIPIVLSVQLARSAVNRTHRRTPGLETLAGTDVIAQVASVVVVVTEGYPPHETTTRRYGIIKNREGEKKRFIGSFQFEPMRFGYIEEDTVEEVDEDEGERPTRRRPRTRRIIVDEDDL